ncbi:MAG: hypothetical protein CMM50_06600 [Rhodospirillaceae bacterium]|nr:hypothetical protein [Rhodospirillaceae bacterium]
METVLVFGGSGFVGRHLVERLLDAGFAVTVFGPSPEPCLDGRLLDRIAFVEGSITDRDAVAAAIRESGADRIVSLAAYGEGGGGLVRAAAADGAKAFAVNVEGFRTLLDAVAEAGTSRLLWASSTTVFGHPSEYGNQPVDETAAPRPASLYGLTKALAEQVADYYRTRHGVAVTGVRLPLLFGPGLWYAGAGAAIRGAYAAAARGEPVTVEGDPAPFDLMYVKDVAALCLHLLRHRGPLAPIYNVNGFTTTFAAIARALAARTGTAVDHRDVPAALLYPPMATGRLEAETGFRPAFDLDRATADFLATLETD